MKKLFPAIVILILSLIVTACSHAVPASKPETETTSAQTEPVANTTADASTDVQSSETETNSEKDEDISDTTSHSTTKADSADKTQTKPSTTVKKETTTKKKVVTTKKPETTTANSKKSPQYSPEAEIVALFNKVNNYRVQNGLSKIAMDPDICKMAYIRAQEQKSLKGHDRPDGSKYYTILDEYDYKYSGCGENIAFIWNVSADEAFNKWKDSPSHNQNMLDPHWTKAGIAMCRNADGSYSIVNIFAC